VTIAQDLIAHLVVCRAAQLDVHQERLCGTRARRETKRRDAVVDGVRCRQQPVVQPDLLLAQSLRQPGQRLGAVAVAEQQEPLRARRVHRRERVLDRESSARE